MSKSLLLILIASFALTIVGEATANGNCGGLNQRVCKKWEQIRGCDSGLHRTSPIGGTCTYDNKLIPNPIERVIAPAPSLTPPPPVSEAPSFFPPVPVFPPTSGNKKSSLPHLSAIPPAQPSAMDGLYKLDILGIPYRIEAGRVYAMADYLHLMIFPVEAYDVVVKDIVQTGPGELSGYDMALIGPWTARLQPNGTMAITVQGILGPVSGTFLPITADNPAWLAQEKASLFQNPNPGYTPLPYPVEPGPIVGEPPVQPVPLPAPEGGNGYPPGWGD